MADPGRLDELKRKFDENPRRYFAPLANEYRKADDAERAIELCRTYLPQQPTHMSGYIVYGQALYDAGRTDEAAAVFQQALTLDPENIIAQRYLGDIARAKGDRGAAIRWYGKVLELDPRNEDITGLIADLASPDEPRRYDGPERRVPPTIRPEPESQGEVLALAELIALPDVPQPEIVVPVAPAPSVTTIETADESVTIIRWPIDEEERAAGLPPEEPVAGASVESMMDFGLDEPLAGAPLTATGIDRSQEESSLADESEWSAEPSSGSDSPFITETMAELYVAQGMRGEALAIYRQLVARDDDPRLTARMRELESQETSAAAQPEEDAGRGAPAETSAAEASATGETVREFFARIGARRADAAPHIGADGESGLSRLFGGASLDSSDVDAAQALAGAFTSASRDDAAPPRE